MVKCWIRSNSSCGRELRRICRSLSWSALKGATMTSVSNMVNRDGVCNKGFRLEEMLASVVPKAVSDLDGGVELCQRPSYRKQSGKSEYTGVRTLDIRLGFGTREQSYRRCAVEPLTAQYSIN